MTRQHVLLLSSARNVLLPRPVCPATCAMACQGLDPAARAAGSLVFGPLLSMPVTRVREVATAAAPTVCLQRDPGDLRPMVAHSTEVSVAGPQRGNCDLALSAQSQARPWGATQQEGKEGCGVPGLCAALEPCCRGAVQRLAPSACGAQERARGSRLAPQAP